MTKNELKAYILSTVGTLDPFLIGEARDLLTEPTYNIQIKPTEKCKKHFAIKVFSERDVFLVWDIQRRAALTKNVGCSLSLRSNTWKGIKTDKETFIPQYKELEHRYSDKWEKVYIVGFNNTKDFLENLYEFMQFNKADEGFPKTTTAEIEDRFDDATREKYSSLHWKRDNAFRQEVLLAYGNRCAICRCEIIDILQAAHEHGYEPGRSNWDDPKHGICLCANHHLMYDRKLLDIDFKKRTIEILNEALTTTYWYKMFVERFDGLIAERSNFREEG